MGKEGKRESKEGKRESKEVREREVKLIGKMRFIIEQVRLLILPPPSLHSVQ